MAGPSAAYLAQLDAALAAPGDDPFAAGAKATGVAPPTSIPAVAKPLPTKEFLSSMLGPLADFDLQKAAEAARAHEAPRTMMDGTDSASTNAAPIHVPGVPSPATPAVAVAPSEAPTIASPQATASIPWRPAEAAPPEEMPPDLQFQSVGGGRAVPAHELYMRGKQQDAHLMSSFEPEGDAATRGDFRNQIQADRETSFYEEQAARAMRQQEVAQQMQQRRADELDGLRADYTDQIQKLGQMKLESNRSWGKKSTPDKIASYILLGIGSIEALGNGGRNPVYDAILRESDQDLAAQKFDYDVGLKQAEGLQSAYAMMLDRYKNEDAAMAAARAAQLDFAAAKAAQLHAQWGATNSANAADGIRSQLAAEKERTIANGFKFVPATVTAPMFHARVRGIDFPAPVTGKEANELAEKHGVNPAERTDEDLTKGGIQATLQAQNNAATMKRELAVASQKEGKDNTVKLPSGEVVTAPSQTEAEKLRGLAAQDLKIRELVSRVKTIRAEGFRTSPGNLGELKSLQQQLRTAFSVSAQLGALSKDDIKIADGAIGDLADPLSVTSAPERQLDAYARMVRSDVANRIKTYSTGADSAPNAQGQLSAEAKKSLTIHGGK